MKEFCDGITDTKIGGWSAALKLGFEGITRDGVKETQSHTQPSWLYLEFMGSNPIRFDYTKLWSPISLWFYLKDVGSNPNPFWLKLEAVGSIPNPVIAFA